ncbi:UNVERIFIED_CONTAM: hypothetical protein Sangu_2416300 [Sesamum angustifolium]|uniref:B box-type domain-containing protein n=1 Tax=Sesamum angustifolium TaxID=2727405 RepID=A0AAW2KZN2_9LAMI
MKRCELCKARARMHCESDQASLCWDCDAKVHSANFLVARHSRNLLCHVCQSPTPWSAAGPKLGPTVSVCEQCVYRRGDESGEEEEEMGERQEVVEENQVVPWSPPPTVESSSSGEESVSGGEVAVSRKRRRIENVSSDFQTDEDQGCSSYQLNTCAPPPPDEAAGAKDSSLSRRKTTPLLHKIKKTELGRVDSCGSGILDSLRRLHQEEKESGTEMAELCMLSQDRRSGNSATFVSR